MLNRKALIAALEDGRVNVAIHPRAELRTGRPTGYEAAFQWEAGHEVLRPVLLTVADSARLTPRLFALALEEISNGRNKAGAGLVATELPESLFLNNDWFEGCLPEVSKAASAGSLEVMLHACFMARVSPKNFRARMDRLRDSGAGLCLVMDATLANPEKFASAFANLPVQALLLSGNLLRQASASARNASLIDSLVMTAKARGMRVIAGGVDTERDAAIAILAGCDQGQGIHISKGGSAKAPNTSFFGDLGLASPSHAGIPWELPA